jgi:microcystin-dependent protein/arginine repressor
MANKLYPFGASATNILTDSQYLADAERAAGFAEGSVPRSAFFSKILKQTALATSALGEFMAAHQGSDVTDGLTPLQFRTILETALSAYYATLTAQASQWRGVEYVGQNTTLTVAQAGKMIAVDTTNGNVTLTLPAISGLTLPFVLGIKKISADANIVTIARSSTDTVSGDVQKVITKKDNGYSLIASIKDTLGRWETTDYSPAAVDTTPAGGILEMASNTTPAGYLYCNGATVPRTAYNNLFNAIGTTYGAGDGVTTFSIPDFRGVFLRGWDNGRGYDAGRAFGSYQEDSFASHTHTITKGYSAQLQPSIFVDPPSSYTSGTYGTISTNGTGANETRPKNAAINFYIKY